MSTDDQLRDALAVMAGWVEYLLRDQPDSAVTDEIRVDLDRARQILGHNTRVKRNAGGRPARMRDIVDPWFLAIVNHLQRENPDWTDKQAAEYLSQAIHPRNCTKRAAMSKTLRNRLSKLRQSQ